MILKCDKINMKERRRRNEIINNRIDLKETGLVWLMIAFGGGISWTW